MMLKSVSSGTRTILPFGITDPPGTQRHTIMKLQERVTVSAHWVRSLSLTLLQVVEEMRCAFPRPGQWRVMALMYLSRKIEMISAVCICWCCCVMVLSQPGISVAETSAVTAKDCSYRVEM